MQKDILIGVQHLMFDQNYGTGHMEISNEKIIDLTVKESFRFIVDDYLKNAIW
jgi:hypothetical protein